MSGKHYTHEFEPYEEVLLKNINMFEQTIARRKKSHCAKSLFIHLLLPLLIALLISFANWDVAEQIETIFKNTETLTQATAENLRNETLAQTLEREVRVLCWILTTPKNHKTKAIHIQRTWGKRCNRLVFMSSEYDEELDNVVLSEVDIYLRVYPKTKAAFLYVYEKYKDEIDWFMKADDDTYVFVENLRYLLYPYPAEMPIYFGHNFKWNSSPEPYMSGGSGYVLSKEALRRFVIEDNLNDTEAKKCRQVAEISAEDVEMSLCLNALGVIAGDSRDSKRKLRFLPFEPYTMLMSTHFSDDFWFRNLTYYRTRTCRDCLSDYAVAFHYVSPENMYMYEYLKYGVKIAETKKIEENLPEKLGMEEIVIPPSDNLR